MGGVLAVEKKVLPCYLRGWLDAAIPNRTKDGF